MLKKCLSVILAFVLLFGVFSVVPFPAFANSEIEQSNVIFDYYLNADDTACITGCYGNDYDFNLIIPSYIEGHKVTSIGRDAFRNNEWILSVTLPDTVISIGDYAFLCCDNLYHVSLGKGLEVIGEYSFQGCELKEIELPESLTTVGEGAFIGGHSITSLRIPKNVTSIGVVSFPSYTLERIEVDEDNPVFDSRDNCNAIIATGTNSLICGSNNTIIPDTVTRIGPCAFECCNFSSINLPESVSFIDRDAFLACYNLSSISMPGVDTIYNDAFLCTSLRYVSLPKIQYVGNRAFSGCPYLHSVYFGKSLSHLDISVFGYGAVAGNDEICGETPLTDIYYEGNETEWGEVRIDKTYYESNQNIFDANMHYNCSKSYYDNLYYTVLGEIFEHDLQWYADNWGSTQYNPELAHLMMTMSNAAYDQNKIKRAYEELGLANYTPYNYEKTWFEYMTENTCYSIGSIDDEDGTICVLVTVRGSGSLFDVSQGSMDWMGNLDYTSLSETGYSAHRDFYNNMLLLYNNLNVFLVKHYHTTIESSNNIKYFITGHSRGAAIANLLENKLLTEAGKRNIYGYNFAVPNNIIVNKNEDMYLRDFIFNISNIRDVVSYSPGFETDVMFSFKQWWESGEIENMWLKRGISIWFDDGGSLIDLGAHDPKRYLKYMRARKPLESYTKLKFDYSVDGWGPFVTHNYKIFVVDCPVDVEVIDENGNVIASIIDGVVDYHGSHYGDVIVVTLGEQKLFAVPEDKNYTLRLVGSDSGTMDYYIAAIDYTNDEATTLKSFEDVALETGKEMIGKTVNVRDEATQQITTDEKLITVEDDPKEILSNGDEIPYNARYILGDADNNGSIEVTDATFVQRRLVDIDTPYSDDVLQQGDADGSGELDLIDVTALQYYLANLKTPYLIGVDVV